MKRSTILLPLVVAACGSQPIVVPVRNLERPSDFGFVCMELANDRLSGRPMTECHPPTTTDPVVDVTMPRMLGTFGLIPNTGRGDLSVFDLDANSLVDLDPAQPGYNTLPLGALPEVMATTKDGCWAVTANRGSCDLTRIDPARLLQGTFAHKTPSTGAGPVAQTVVPTTASGRPLGAAPDEIVALPVNVMGLTGAEHLCRTEGAYTAGTDEAAPWRAIVTFPGCDLVALVDLLSGRIVSSVQIRADGVVNTGAEPVCSAECGAGPAVTPVAAQDAAAGDAGVGDGGATSGPLGIGALALLPKGNRVYVGGAHADFITALDVAGDRLVAPPDGGRITLHEQPGGVSRLRLSADPWREQFVGTKGDFLYAFAGDGSVRVVEVNSRSTGDFKERECDTNIDTSARPDLAADRGRGCFAIPDDGTQPWPRLPRAQGPGLRVPPTPFLINTDAPPIPRDIAFGNFSGTGIQGDAKDFIQGAFGFLLASTGGVYAINIDPGISSSYPSDQLPMSHRIRNAALGNTKAHVVGTPAPNFTTTDVPVPIRVALAPLQGPRIEPVLKCSPSDDKCQSVCGTAAACDPRFPAESTRTLPLVPDYASFPSPDLVPHEQVLIAWEDTLPNSSRSTGRLRPPSNAGLTASLDDPGASFCGTGVLAGDVMLLSSCVQDADCFPRGLSLCQQSTPGAPGVCFPSTVPRDAERLRRCARLLGSRRRYDIVRSTPTRLDLALKISELPRTSLDPCARDADCQTSSTFMGYECKQVREGEPRRCVKSCREDRDCRSGTVCETVPGGAMLCVDAPPLNAANVACFPGEINYKVQAGNSFLVTHSLLSTNGLSATPAPTVHTTKEEGGVCVIDPARSPVLVNRIPLSAPACTGLAATPDALVSTKDARDKMPMAAMEPGNPCLFRSPNADETSPTDACTTDQDCQTGAGFVCVEIHYGEGRRCVKPHVKALFQTPDYRIVLTNLDQYAGDAVRMRFEIDGGFLPSAASTPEDILISMPFRIVTGPTKTPDSPTEQASPPMMAPSFPYFYIVDQGRTATAPGGRGQVLRLDPRAGATGQIASGLSTSTRSRFQVQ